MNVQEYRDLIDHCRDALASARSTATRQEADKECEHLERVRDELQAAECRTAKPKDRQRAARCLEAARQHVYSHRFLQIERDLVGYDL